MTTIIAATPQDISHAHWNLGQMRRALAAAEPGDLERRREINRNIDQCKSWLAFHDPHWRP